MLKVQFIHIPEDRMSDLIGPFEFVQLTYSSIRVGPDGDKIIAECVDGFWVEPDGTIWTDVAIS